MAAAGVSDAYDAQRRVVLVTGCASGLGAADARALTARGHRVCGADVTVDAGEQVLRVAAAAAGTSARDTPHFVRCNVADEADVQRLIAACVARFGRLDAAFNNAGIIGCKRGFVKTEYWETAEFDAAMLVNVRGVFLCLKHELRQFRRQREAERAAGDRRGPVYHVLNTASVAGISGRGHGQSGYAASKHAVVGLTRTAATEYGKNGIAVNCICPSIIDTPMTTGGSDAARELIQSVAARTVPMARMGNVDDVVPAALYLLSPAASFVSGIALPIDGAMTCH